MSLTKKIVPVAKVVSIIDSCVTLDQLKNSRNLISNYMDHIIHMGCQNPWEVSAILKVKYQEKYSEITK